MLFLKTYEGDAEDLCLTFSITQEVAGEVRHFCGATTRSWLTPCVGGTCLQTREVELVRGGADLDVTNANKMRYIYLAAHALLNTRCGWSAVWVSMCEVGRSQLVCVHSMKKQCNAFRRGLSDLIPAEWLAMFSEPELQVRMWCGAWCASSFALTRCCVSCRR